MRVVACGHGCPRPVNLEEPVVGFVWAVWFAGIQSVAEDQAHLHKPTEPIQPVIRTYLRSRTYLLPKELRLLV